MRSQIALAATLATALISATPALALPNMGHLETTQDAEQLSPPAQSMFTRRKISPRLLRPSVNRGRVQRIIEEPAR
jgi:hypothetical protein